MFVKTWQERHMAVRQGTLYYADKLDDVMTLAASLSHRPGDVHVIDLKGCSVEHCAKETDAHHCAFKLVTPEVILQHCTKANKRHCADPHFAGAGAAVVHRRCRAQTGHYGDR
jgi:hypothetical protein